MPSTVVHLAIAGLVGVALLGDEIELRTVCLLLFFAAIPDLDTFIGIALPGTHRAILHTILVPLVAAGLITYDTLGRERSFLRSRGRSAVRLAWVGVAVYVFAGIGPDLFFNGVNLFYPLYDRFFALSGEVFISNQRGLVQTLWDTTSTRGTTANTHYYTGVDVVRGPDPPTAERIFPVAASGLQALLILVSGVVLTCRLWETRQASGPKASP